MSLPRSPSPLSEGEIVSEGEEKAISTNATHARDGKVNMSARLHSGSSSRTAHHEGRDALMSRPHHRSRDESPYRRDRSRSRSRSPYRASKPTSGDKRRHEDDHYNRKAASDPRRFKVHYESEPTSRDSSQYRSGRRQESSFKSSGDRDRERDRERSRSPFRHSNAPSRSEMQNGASRRFEDPSKRMSGAKYEEKVTGKPYAGVPISAQRESTPPLSHGQDDAKVKMSLSQHSEPKPGPIADKGQGSTAPDRENSEDIGEPQKQLSEAELIEQRRKRREEIRTKHKNNPPLLLQALQHAKDSAPVTPLHDSSGAPSEQQSPPSSMTSPKTPQGESPPGSPAAFAVNNDEDLVDRRNSNGAVYDEEGPSAADYDPNLDMEEDRPDHKRQDLQESAMNGEGDNQQQENNAVPKQPKEFDMFADDDDDDDMFAPAETTVKPTATGTSKVRALDQSLLDNWDYPDGHYRIILGELLDGRYAVQQQIGKGTFATVVRAQDTRTGNLVAVKIACNNDTMYKAGQKEMDMLHLLNQSDPDDKKHIIRLLRHFDHKGHLCLVFENLSADLREVLKKFGRNVGLNLKAIRSYAQQMFLSLSHMKKCQILHADLKPDNILVSEKRSMLKICDLGTAAFADDAEVTPYLVSRFYRAPEVILGMPFDYAIDMWSIGCTLFELYTGRILFAGSDNNQMLRAIQECRGKFPIRMLKRSTLADKHFDVDGNFFSQERDKITGKASLRQMNFNKTAPGRDLRSRLSGNTKGMRPEEVKEHASFVDLMERCLQLDPARRVSPNEALRHGFITHGGAGQPQEKGQGEKVKVAMNVPRMK